MHEASFSRLYGLIIGINKYKSPAHHDLEGCVGDAKAILKYLTEDLGAPAEQLVCLFDEQATRKNILDTFCSHLLENPNIKPFDPIVIYYAGHGDQRKAPVEWGASDGNMETILPHDAGFADDNDEYIHGIPDRTLGAMLYRLNQAKGNNITVIMDSCHSGSGTRGHARVRSSHDPDAPVAPCTLDEDLLRALPPNPAAELYRDVTSKESSWKYLAPSLETHILLAACHCDEKSNEIPNRDSENPPSLGIFTSALLEELKKCDISTTSYSTLIRNVLFAVQRKASKYGASRLERQTPQCEGRNQDRLLFSTQFSVSKGKISLIQTSSKGIFRIRVGSALGIVPGTEFGVFSGSMGSTSAPIAQLVASDVGPTGAFLVGLEPNMPVDLPPDAYATVIKYNDHSNGVRILVRDKGKLPDSWGGVLQSLESLPVVWAEPGETSDLVLVPTKDGVELQRTSLSPGQPQPAHIHLSHDLGPQKLVEILTAVVYFHFHLQRRNPEAPVQAQLRMSLEELNESFNRWGAPQYSSKGQDLFGDCLSNGTTARLQADSNKLFGLKLTNNSKANLFPYVLYYDLEDYSVSCLYEPPSRSMKAPLVASGGSISIGYGSGGAQPFQVDFTNPSSVREYGAFVLLVFSEWVDIAYLQQESPLETPGDKKESRGELPRKYPPTGVWDKLCVRVEMVQ